MSITITTLIENSIGEHKGLSGEHGLSFFIDKDGEMLLFDTGSSRRFIDNANKLLVDVGHVRHVILSHGHYDHTGGFRPFVEAYPDSQYTLWTGKGFFEKKYGIYGPSLQYLGNDFDELFLETRSISHKEVTADTTEIAPGAWIVTNFKKIHSEELIHPRFVLWDDATRQVYPDEFRDEVLLVVEAAKGLVVLVGCAHPGILNMLDTVEERFDKPIYALLGGTHLVEASSQRIRYVINDFIKRKISIMGVSHCTGEAAVSFLEERSHTSFRNSTGSTLSIE
ncbi:MBL fold metallo-hydrolase [Sediminispirochaeta smaragdinae]|uniref:Metallo-beta-lactamase domain-containing protein n=1 Tax=Sediminispirochaeta smaragdinae (strain DSM 11293 / JCM 15392 / SEBR 4228) TaxID=573413 RepID=E1RAM4_SEDSS|nr:MBL fold metallo-hydrolase [Sediminispirochaeta smaragdinae]ADK82392.1 conserved hypothetical protein [Sediminispirochaeta smaragdinae DSM 11293]